MNTLAQGEATLVAGAGSQSGTGNRWGDYSALTVDPVDDCTFWYTTEYYTTTSSFNWHTRIGTFKFPQCNSALGTLQGTVTDAATYAPIEGASVQLSGGSSTSTNASGAYSINVPQGTYSVTFSKAGYVTQTVNNVVVNVGATTTLNAAFVNLSVPKVLVTANGNHGALTLSAGQGLQVAIAFSSGNSFFPQAELYVGVARQDGTTLWLNPNTGMFGPTIAPVYQGPLGTFGPAVALTIPDVSALAPGNYWWLAIVDNDMNGVPNVTLLDYTRTTIQ